MKVNGSQLQKCGSLFNTFNTFLLYIYKVSSFNTIKFMKMRPLKVFLFYVTEGKGSKTSGLVHWCYKIISSLRSWQKIFKGVVTLGHWLWMRADVNSFAKLVELHPIMLYFLVDFSLGQCQAASQTRNLDRQPSCPYTKLEDSRFRHFVSWQYNSKSLPLV